MIFTFQRPHLHRPSWRPLSLAMMIVLGVGSLLWTPRNLHAEGCPSGDLLYNLSPVKPTINVQRSLRITDGKQLKEGTFWSVEAASIIKVGGKVTFDLKEPYSLRGFTLQGDNNDEYVIKGSLDGTSYTKLWTVPKVKTPGLQTRSTKLKAPSTEVRYLQLSAKGGDKSYSVSELQAFCKIPKVWPPKPALTRAIRKNNKDIRKHFIGKAKIGFALFGILIFFLPRLLRPWSLREEDEEPHGESDSSGEADSTPDPESTSEEIESTSEEPESTSEETESTLEEAESVSEEAEPTPEEAPEEVTESRVKTQNPGVSEQIDVHPTATSPSSSKWWVKHQLLIRTLITHLVSLVTAGYMLLLGGLQMNRTIDIWADNGLLNQGVITAIESSSNHGRWVFINGLFLSLVALGLLGYLIVQIKNERPLSALIPELQSIGFIGALWVVMTQADEVLGKTSSWWPDGWEGLVIASLLSGVFFILYRRSLAESARAEEGEEDELVINEVLRQSGVRLRSTQKVGWSMIVFLGLMTWVSLGSFHGNKITHYWDSFHYYVGSKYFAENRYHLLYHCTSLAEVDDGRKSKLKSRPLRNLTNNQVGKSEEVFDPKNPMVKQCRSHFSPQRWAAFKQDIRLFRSYMGEAWWKKMFKDHGYNATPVWNMVGSYLTQRDWASKIPPPGLEYTPAKKGVSATQRAKAKDQFYKVDRPRFQREIIQLNLIDLTLYLLLFTAFLWAFGLEITAFTLLFFASGYPWSYDWTGGSVGRIPWLFTATFGLCFLKRGYPLLGGFSLGWSLLLRVFPGAVLGGFALQLGLMTFKKMEWNIQHKRMLIGGLLSFATLMPMSLPIAQGTVDQYKGVTTAYSEFLDNSFKHKNTPLTNNMGYPTLLTYHPGYTVRYASQKQRKMKKKGDKKPAFSLWKQKRTEFKKQRMPIFILTIIAMFGALYVKRHRWGLWEMTSASVIFIFLIFELTCYYFSFLILLAPLAYKRGRDIFGLLFFVIASQVIQILVGATDEEYLNESLFLLIPCFALVIGHVLEEWTPFKGEKKILPTVVS